MMIFLENWIQNHDNKNKCRCNESITRTTICFMFQQKCQRNQIILRIGYVYIKSIIFIVTITKLRRCFIWKKPLYFAFWRLYTSRFCNTFFIWTLEYLIDNWSKKNKISQKIIILFERSWIVRFPIFESFSILLLTLTAKHTRINFSFVTYICGEYSNVKNVTPSTSTGRSRPFFTSKQLIIQK